MSTGRPATRHCAAARRWHNRSRGWRGIHAATAIGVRRAGVAGDRMGAQREPPRGLVAANGGRTCRHRCHRAGAAQAAAGGKGVRRHQRRRQHDLGGDARRHFLRVRLSRRRRPALRSQGARRGFHPGVSGAADRAGHERSDDAACSTGASCRRSCAAWHGCWSARSASAARWGCRPRRISFSAWSRRRCSSAPIWRSSPAANCFW